MIYIEHILNTNSHVSVQSLPPMLAANLPLPPLEFETSQREVLQQRFIRKQQVQTTEEFLRKQVMKPQICTSSMHLASSSIMNLCTAIYLVVPCGSPK